MPGELPHAVITILLIAARDMLLIPVALPLLKGERLQQALPYLLEEQLVQEPQDCHIALGESLPDGQRLAAVLDRAWFGFVCKTFKEAGHNRLRAVPLAQCVPQPLAELTGTAASEVATAAGENSGACFLCEAVTAPQSTDSAKPWLEFTLAQQGSVYGAGMTVPFHEAAQAVELLCRDSTSQMLPHAYWLDLPAGQTAATSPPDIPVQWQRVSFETLARRALACKFDLCQFEFANHAAGPMELLKRYRIPLLLLAAALAVAIIGANVRWWRAQHEQRHLLAEQRQLLREAFPQTQVILDAPLQMSSNLKQLRALVGEALPDSFLALAGGLNQALGKIPRSALTKLVYQDHQLTVWFKQDANPDSGFAQRLTAAGVAASLQQDRWVIRSKTQAANVPANVTLDRDRSVGAEGNDQGELGQ
jgi:general secretion pathway protein L